MIAEGGEPFWSDHHSIQTKKSKNPHQHIRAIQRNDNDEPPAFQPQYTSDNEEYDEQIENASTGVIQDMHNFSAASTSEDANPIHGGRNDEAVGDDDNLEEDMDDIDCEIASVMKERVATSTRDGYERCSDWKGFLPS